MINGRATTVTRNDVGLSEGLDDRDFNDYRVRTVRAGRDIDDNSITGVAVFGILFGKIKNKKTTLMIRGCVWEFLGSTATRVFNGEWIVRANRHWATTCFDGERRETDKAAI